MKIYLLCDMEGTSGISKTTQVQSDSGQPYQQGRELLIADVNAAVAGAVDGGATEVVACDTHGGGGHFFIEKLDQRAVYETPGMKSLMPALDSTFDGVILMGHHAMAGTLNGFLDHTMSSASWFECSVNGVPLGEIGIESAWAGHFDMPVIMVHGDQAACREAETQLPGVVTAPVKEGIGRNKARCLSVDVAHDLIRKAAAEAVGKARSIAPFKPDLPAEVKLILCRSDYADERAGQKGVSRLDARTVTWTAETACQIIYP